MQTQWEKTIFRLSECIKAFSPHRRIMAKSNQQGRALEYIFRNGICRFARSKGLKVEVTPRTMEKDSKERGYFNALDSDLKKSFTSCAETFPAWLEGNGWLDGAVKLELDRVPDSEARQNIEMTDVRLAFSYKDGRKKALNLSVKHHHDALCHPRLPSLAEQCGIKDERLDSKYREKYKKIWKAFYSKARELDKKTAKFSDLKARQKDFVEAHLYVPLLRLVIGFLQKNANNAENARAFFEYLVGKVDYYVVKNGDDSIEIKPFVGIAPPKSFSIAYPFKSRKNTFLIEFDNGWQISCRLHTANKEFFRKGKIFMSEKLDPICINLDRVMEIEELPKQ